MTARRRDRILPYTRKDGIICLINPDVKTIGVCLEVLRAGRSHRKVDAHNMCSQRIIEATRLPQTFHQ